jgi:hypothetical protein
MGGDMAGRAVQSFLNEIADVERERAIGDFYDTERDLELLVQAVLSYATKALNIRGLDSKAQAAEAIDIPALRSAVDSLDREEIRNSRIELPGDQKPLVGKDDLAQAREMLVAVERAAEDQHPLETGIRVELGLSFAFFRLQLAVAEQPAVLDDVSRQVRNKLATFGEEDIRRLWAMLTAEFRTNEDRADDPPIPADHDVLGPNFFDPVTVDDIRDRIGKYAVRLRPILVKRLLQSGVKVFRAILPKVPQLLAAQIAQPITLQERRILECLLKIYRVWGSDHGEEFQNVLGLTAPHWMQRAASLDGTLRRNKETPSRDAKDEILLINLRRLLNYTEDVVNVESSVERVLVQYKLGLEVMLPQSRDVVAEKRELELQKELCRFLVERDVRAFGKSFGRTEVDLLAEIPGERFLIETKIVEAASSNNIDRNVTQLISYMDHEEPATRGVLVLYNVSNTVVISDRKWFRQRLWVLPINLCDRPPSKAKRRLLIEDGGEDTMLRFVPSWNESSRGSGSGPRKRRPRRGNK